MGESHGRMKDDVVITLKQQVKQVNWNSKKLDVCGCLFKLGVSDATIDDYVEEFEQNNWVTRGESHRLFDRRELSFDTKASRNLNVIKKISVNFFYDSTE